MGDAAGQQQEGCEAHGRLLTDGPKLLVIFATATAAELAPEVVRAEELAVAGDLPALVSTLEAYTAAHPDDCEGLWRGVSLLCKGYNTDDAALKAEGRMWLNKAATTPGDYPTDVIDHRQIPVILQREADVCGYSRDGWEDLTEEAYAKRK